MFNEKLELKKEMQRSAKAFVSNAVKGRVRGGFLIEYSPAKIFHACRLYSLPSEDFNAELSVFADLLIDFNADRASWKKAYRTMRVAQREYLDVSEELTKWELEQGTFYRLIAAHCTVASLEQSYLQEQRKARYQYQVREKRNVPSSLLKFGCFEVSELA